MSTLLHPPRSASPVDAPPVEPVARGERFALSLGQERLWFLDRLRPEATFNNAATYALHGPLDVDALRLALAEAVRRQGALRTVIEEEDGRPVAVVLPELDVPLPFLDFTGRPEEAREWMLAEAPRSFDTARGPLFRATLLKLGEDEHVLLPVVHNLVSDGWSGYVLFHELAELYGAYAEGRPSPLPPVTVSYGEYAAKQRERFSGEALERELAWWRAKLGDARTLRLPTDRPRPAVPDFHAPLLTFQVPKPTADALWVLARGEGVSLFTVLLAAYQVFVGRWAGTTDVLVGGAAANRDRREAQGLIGFFLNTLPLRMDLSDDPTFRALLPRVLEGTLEAASHGELPFERLVAELEPGGDLTASPLCSTCFILHNAPWPTEAAAGVAMEMELLRTGMSRFDLIVSLRQSEEGLITWVQYRRDLFDDDTIRRLAADYTGLLAEVVRDPDRPVSRLPLPAAEERRARDSAAPAAQAGDRAEDTAGAGDDDPVAAAVAGVFAEVLGVDHVRAGDDFFARGGHWNQAPRVAARLRAALGVDVPVRALFEAPTAARLARRIAAGLPRGGEPSPASRLPEAGPPRDAASSPEFHHPEDVPVQRIVAPDARPPREGDFPLSFPQERVWLAEQVDPGTPAWNVVFPVRLRGPLEVGALRAALDECARRHPALRTTFPEVDDLPVQRIAATAEVPLRVEDLSAVPAGEREAALHRRLAEEGGRPFSLGDGPLNRVSLFRLAPDEHVLLLAIHHIVGDGWSLGVLFRELAALYGAAVRGEPSPLPEPLADYADHAVWQRERLTDAALAKPLAYWRRALAGAPAVLELPGDRPGPAAPGVRAMAGGPLSAAALAGARAIARSEGATAFMVQLAAFGALLSRWTGAQDLVIGVPDAGRTRKETEAVVGFFVNTLPIRLDLSGDPGFRTLVRRATEAALGAFEHAAAPFEKVVQAVRPARAPGHNPVFQVMFAPQPLPSLQFAGLAAEVVGSRSSFSLLPLVMALAEDPAGATVSIQYAPDLFDARTAERLAEGYVRLLESAAAQPDAPLSTLPVFTGEDALDVAAARPVAPAAPVVVPRPPAEPRADDAPRTAMERLLAGMWAEVLERDRVGVNDDFYDLGGHSLIATQVVARVRRTLFVELTVRAMLDRPTLRTLAAHVDALLAARAAEQDPSAAAPSAVAAPSAEAAEPVESTEATESIETMATMATAEFAAASPEVEEGLSAELASAAGAEPEPAMERGASDVPSPVASTVESDEDSALESPSEPVNSAQLLEELQRRGAVVFPQSFAQQRLWFLDQMMPGTAVYNVPVAFRLTGALDVDALQRTLNEMVRRHEVLRTVLASLEGLPVQVVLPEMQIPLPLEDLSHLPPGEREAEAERLTMEEARRTFDLSRGPLVRARLLRMGSQEHLLRVVMHHAVSDGWSLGVLFPEIGELYAAFAAGLPSPLPELEVQYADFSVWQRDALRGPAMEREMAYWRPLLAGAPDAVEIPTDRPRPVRPTYAGDGHRVDIPAAVTAGMAALARRESATTYMVLLAAFKALLSRWSGQTDLVIGAPMANRTRPEVEPLIGFFVNTLPLRTDLSGDPTFGELLARVRDVSLGAFGHQEVPLERLVEELAPGRDPARSPLFQVAFVLQNAPWARLELGGVRMELEMLETGTSRFDLTFSLREADGGVRGRMEYSTELFDDDTMEGVHRDLVRLLEAASADPGIRLSELPLPFVDAHRRARLSGSWEPIPVDGIASPSPASSPVPAVSVDAIDGADAAVSPSPASSPILAVSGDGDAIGAVDATASPSPAAVVDGAADANGAGTSDGDAEPAAEVRVAPLSFAQERFWMAHRMDPASSAWNVPFVRRIRGALDVDALERALGEIVTRHEPLRTTLEVRDGHAVQVVRAPGAFRLPVTDLRPLAADAREPEALRLTQAEVHRAFDLAHGPVFYTRLLRLDADDHLLSMVVHHVATDGWSVGVLLGELNALYDAFSRGAPSPLAPLPTTYADHAAFQRWWLTRERLAEQLAYWRARLDGAPPALELPLDRPPPATRTFRGDHLMLEVPAEVAGRVRAFARSEGVTTFMAMLAAWTAVLSRWSGQDDVVVGSPIANRTRRETEPLVGAFVNVLPLRTDLSGDPSFRALAARVRDTTIEAYAHQDLPFEKLVGAVGGGRSVAHHPVFQTMFALQNAPTAALRMGGLQLEGVNVTADGSPFDFDLLVSERPGGEMLALLEYSTELFERATAERVARHFVRLLDAATADPDAPVETLELMDADERRRVLHDWNATATAYPRDATIPALFAEVAAGAPESVALVAVDGGARTTYAELEARANRLARHLRARGVTPGSRVALAMDRSPDAVVAMLAALKAGASYVPLNPAYPEARAAVILNDAGCAAVVVHDAVSFSPGALSLVSLVRDAEAIAAHDASPLPIEATAESEAYVIYTSGSTGRPKGVSVPQRAVVRLVRESSISDFRADDVTLALTSLSFDVSAVELWGSLLNGGCLAMFPPRVPALAELGDAIRDHGVTRGWLPNGVFNEMVDRRPGDLLPLRELNVGGEAMSTVHARRALERIPDVALMNGYGPTENGVVTTRRRVVADDVERASIPIGEPVSNTRVYVLDERLRPVPVGVPGELCTAGDGLAAGYVGLPGFTAERFVEVDLGEGVTERVYRTRDRVRWLPGGTLEFLGRMDEQVKVRGFRVEPGEIEEALRTHPEVRDAAVVARDDAPGGTRLVAYVVGSNFVPPDAAALRAHLRGTLPEYMLPAAFVPLGALPTTPAGKVDRRALPAPEAPRSAAGRDDAGSPAARAALPRTGLERRLAALWGEVLEIEQVGLDDNFFELGGHSLLLTLLHARLEEEFPDIRVELLDLFRHTTVRTLADHLASASAEPVERKGDVGAEPARPASSVPSAVDAGAAAEAEDRAVSIAPGTETAAPVEPECRAVSIDLGAVSAADYVTARATVEAERPAASIALDVDARTAPEPERPTVSMSAADYVSARAAVDPERPAVSIASAVIADAAPEPEHSTVSMSAADYVSARVAADPEHPAVSIAPTVEDAVFGDGAGAPVGAVASAGTEEDDGTEVGAEPAAEVRVAPLSFTQERFWMAHRMDPGSAAWNVPFVRRLRGALDVAAFRRALGEIVARHEPLRTTLEVRDGQPVQVVRAPRAFPLPITDLRHLPADEREAEAVRLAQADAERPFDLAAGPVIFTRLLRLDGDDHVFSMVVHHVATDGWSMGVFLGELNALYDAFSRGAPSPLAPLPTTYADHASWQRWWLSGERLAEQLAYWRARLDGAPAALELPVDRPRPAARTFHGEHLMLEVPAAVADRVRAFARGESVTAFMALLAGWTAVLSRWSGQRDVVVGSPIAHRSRRETEPLIGAFVNVLPLRADLSDRPSFRELTARARDATLGALAHQDLPFEKLVDAVGGERSTARHPVFQAMFALQNASTIPAMRLGGLQLEGVDLTAAASPFDFDLMVFERPGGGDMLGLLEYSTELFERATAERLFRHFVRLLDAATADPDAPVDTLELMDADERRRVLHDWNATATAYPHDATIPALFAEAAALAPDAVALVAVDGGARATYAELEARANRLARLLRARGVTPGSRVALAMERSSDAVIAMLAVLKAGASYVPLDPAYPDARVTAILEDAQCAAVVVQGSASLPAGGLPVVSLVRDADAIAGQDASPLALEATAESEAYVIYTSGSTGRPKGVSVPHRGVVRLVRDTNLSDFSADDVTLGLTSLSFDVSAAEVWGALLNGGRLAVFPSHVPALAELGAAIRDHGVTLAWLPNGLFNEMVDRRPRDLMALREIDVGGEALSVAHARQALERLPGVRLVNGYGPTENGVITTRRLVVPEDAERASIPIGEPISNTRVYVLDERLRPVAVGVPGELCAAGDGLATGYVGLPEATAARFVEVELDGVTERVYRSGDRARWLPGGTIEFLGRMDEQVKVRGFRVEPGEVEAALRTHPEVRDAAVVPRDDVGGGTRLVAYVVGSNFLPPETAALRAHLRRTLPDYMLPAAFVPLGALPTTPSGKVDRKALPAPEAPRADADSDTGAETPARAAALPRTGLERRLAALWAEVLEIEQVGLDDNFFELGGHSLLLTLLHARLEEEFSGIGLDLLDLFRHTTVRTLADHIAASSAAVGEAVHEDAAAERPAVSIAPAVYEDAAEPEPLAVSSFGMDADADAAPEPERPAFASAEAETGAAAVPGDAAADGPSVAFLFPGLGDQYPGMGRGLYETEPAFREAVDRCAEILVPLLGMDVRAVLWPADLPASSPSSTNGKPGLDLRKMLARGATLPDPHAERLNRTEMAHPAVFVIGYALAKTWESRGIRPEAVIGHSLGEYTAACVAGVLTLDDALALVAGRARLIGGLPGGAMLAVSLSEEAVRPHLVPGAVVATVSAPESCVVAGPEEAVEEVRRSVAAAGHAARRLPTTHAFHTPMVAPAAAELAALAAGMRLAPPRIPLASNLTGTWMTAEEATDPAYWSRHLVEPVRFDAGLDTLLAAPGRVLVEVGPGQTLGTFVRQRTLRPGDGPPTVVSSLRHAYEVADDAAYLQIELDRLRTAVSGDAEERAESSADEPRPAAHVGDADASAPSPRAAPVPSLDAAAGDGHHRNGGGAEDDEGFRSVLPRGIRINLPGAPEAVDGGELLGIEEGDWAAVRRVELEVDGPAEGITAFLRARGFQVTAEEGGDAARRLTAVRPAAPAPRWDAAEDDASAPSPWEAPDEGPAHGEVEAGIADIWEELLGEAPGPSDDFFLLGGHSLLATQLLSRVRDRYGVELSLIAVFRARTLSAFASLVEEALSLDDAVALSEEEALGLV